MQEFQIDSGKFCGYVQTDDNGIIIDSMPIIRKFIGQPLENLIGWINNKFRYCKLTEINK